MIKEKIILKLNSYGNNGYINLMAKLIENDLNKDRYIERSPIHHCEQLDAALLLFQGLEDKVVPPEQARSITKQLTQTKKPVALVEYTNEGHGFRRAETIQHMLEVELYFYQKVLKLKTTFDKQPIDINNK